MLNRIALAAAYILVLAPLRADDSPAKPTSVKQNLGAIQGIWWFNDDSLFFWISWMDDKRFPHFEDFRRSRSIRIVKDRLRYGDKLQYEIPITVGDEGGKKTIRFHAAGQRPIVGIYEVDKSALRICVEDPELGGRKDDGRLPEKCDRTRYGWFVRFDRAKP